MCRSALEGERFWRRAGGTARHHAQPGSPLCRAGEVQKFSGFYPWAYKTYRKNFGGTYLKDSTDLERRRQQVHSGPMLNAIAQRNGEQIGQRLHNDLEKVVLPEFPAVQRLRDTFQQLKPLGTMMSGSGPTVFALVESQDAAQEMKERVKTTIANPDLDLWVARFRKGGIQVVEERKG